MPADRARWSPTWRRSWSPATGIGTDTAGQILVTVGDNPDRVHSEAAFAMLCGVAPLPASSGKTQRHRLNRGGDRQANRAIHVIATTRKRCDPRTQAYIKKKEGRQHTQREATRSLKRLIAREVYYLLRPAIAPGRSGLTSHRGRLLHLQATPAGAQARSTVAAEPTRRPSDLDRAEHRHTLAHGGAGSP